MIQAVSSDATASWSTIDSASTNQQQSQRRSQSTQQAVSSRQMDEVPSTDSGLSWMKRVSWLRTSSNRNTRGAETPGATVNTLDYWLEYRAGSGDAYFGGTMDSGDHPLANTSPVEALHGSSSMQTHPSPTQNDTIQHPADHDRTTLRQPSSRRISSWFSSNKRPASPKPFDEDDSVCDFRESEWTPQDTSYGAAIPVGGWIPKTIRRLIEWTLIGTVICSVAFLVITTSIKISGSDSRTNSTMVSGLSYDDDPYNSYRYNYGNRDIDDDAVIAGNYTNATLVADTNAQADDDGITADDATDSTSSGGYNPDNDGSYYNYAYRYGGSN
ncbi:hypothetical protein MPSEU_000378500 [Mayamaea pseudoterrestris]|nr:hypothetical protein MPSEU_000378500 [Mayamaea pseudoterrestris]